MKLLDPHQPFLDRAPARWLTALLPLLWAGVEFWMGQPLWGGLFLAAGLYAGYMLFVIRPRGDR